MNRADKRRNEREIKKLNKVLNKFTPQQLNVVEALSNEKGKIISDTYIAKYAANLDRNISAALIEHGFDLETAFKIENTLAELMIEDTKKVMEIESQYEIEEECEMAVKKMNEEVKLEAKKLIEKGVTKKEAIETLRFKFPKLSKSMVTNEYQKLKEEIQQENPEVKEAVEYIFSDGKKKEDVKQAKEKETSKKVEQSQGEKTEDSEKKNEVEEKMNKDKTAGIKKDSFLKPILMGGENFVYRFSPEKVEIEKGTATVITEECIKEQQEALRLWKENYSA